MKKTQHNMMQVAPGDGRLVRYPAGHIKAGQVIPAGARVPKTSYFVRRLECGDLVELEAPAPEAPASEAPPPADTPKRKSKGQEG